MISQLIDQTDRAYAKAVTMVAHWGLTGKWPAFRNAPVYVVRQALACWTERENFRRIEDFPDTPPPWDAKHAAIFLDHTVLWWYSMERKKWSAAIAENAFDHQERIFNTHNPID